MLTKKKKEKKQTVEHCNVHFAYYALYHPLYLRKGNRSPATRSIIIVDLVKVEDFLYFIVRIWKKKKNLRVISLSNVSRDRPLEGAAFIVLVFQIHHLSQPPLPPPPRKVSGSAVFRPAGSRMFVSPRIVATNCATDDRASPVLWRATLRSADSISGGVSAFSTSVPRARHPPATGSPWKTRRIRRAVS